MNRQTFVLPPGVARCIPGNPCARRGQCARALAPHDQGRPVEDFTYGTEKPFGCAYLMSPADIPPPAAEKKQAHDFVKGLL